MKRLKLSVALVVFIVQQTFAAEVLLKTKWIEDHKNRVTVTATLRVDKAHKSPNKVGQGKEDGDLHMAGRAPAVGLPLVVEIVNARLQASASALAAVKEAVKTKQPVEVSGAWRLWFEHPAKEAQTQGETVPVPPHTNPDHVFEIHPVTQFGGDSLTETFVPIPDYEPHEAERAFRQYESLVFTVTKQSAFASIEAKKAGFNYVEFVMVITGAPKKTADEGGWMALAKVEDVDGTVLVHSPRRMVFAPGTRPAEIIATAKKGQRFHAMGILRVNLERLATFADKTPGEPVAVKGAYEMIIVGIFEDE